MKLYVVGFGSGSRECMTAEAEAALEKSELIVGYKTYIDIIKGFMPEKNCLSTGMRQETEIQLYII